jgi:hypothetical protein
MAMRRALACAFVVLSIGAQDALALQTGAPRKVRTARPPDALPHPSSRWEDWSVQLVDPRSSERLAIRIWRTPEEGSGVRIVPVEERRAVFPLEFAVAPAARRSLRWNGPDGGVRLTHRRTTWTLRLSFPDASGVIRLRRARPGITAERWHLGGEAGIANDVNVSWSTPVGTSRAAGALRVRHRTLGLPDRTLDLRGWRATVEHRWGTIAGQWRAWANLTSAAVHTRGGDAWLLHGMNRRDFLTGLGARDAFWLGLLVHVTPSRITFCRPRIVRTGWAYGARGPIWIRGIRAACGGSRVRFAGPRDSETGHGGSGWFESEWRTSARPRGAAWMRFGGHD